MYKNKTILCIIPARGGSKGLPDKNIKDLLGKPLIAYSIEQARACRYIDKVIVSTDSVQIAKIARESKAEVPFIRPKYLATDTASGIDVLMHAVDWMEKNGNFNFDIVVLLLVTSPLRSVKDIDKSIELLFKKKAVNVFSVTESHRNPYFNMVEIDNLGAVKLVKKGNFVRRQSAPKVFDMNASIYIWRKDILKNKKKLFLKNTRLYFMPKQRSVDIDDGIDFKIVEMLMKNRMRQE